MRISDWSSDVCSSDLDRAHTNRVSGARASDHPENLAAADIEIEILMDDLFAEAVLQAANADDRFTTVGHQIHPIQVKKTAKNASSTITRKIACTTALVVRRPTCSASDSTSMP